MPLQQLFTSRKVYDATTYVAHKGTMFYDETAGLFRLGDGSTPGGKVVANLAIAATGTTAPINPYPGELWYNPTTKELWAYHNGAFRGTINVATTSTLGGIKAGPGVVIASDGSLSLDSTGISFSFGDFYAFTNPGPSDGACLGSINANQDINLVSNGSGTVNIVGECNIHRTNSTLEDALLNEPIVRVSSAGKVTILTPNAGGLDGAVEIVGSSTYSTISPNQTGVVLHVTGNTGMVSRNYLDGVNNYSLLVGRRYNGSATSPTNVKSGELIFRLVGQASTATGFETFGPCQIDWVATEDQGINNQGGELRFRATPNGSNAFAGIVTATTVSATGTTSVRFFGPLTGNVTGNVNATAVTATNITVTGNINGNLSGTTVTASSFVGSSLTLAGGTTTTYALKFNTGTMLTTAQPGVIGYDGTVFYATPVDQERGIVVTEQKYILNAARALTNDLVPQSLFGAGFHVTSGVRYRYQILCTVTKTAGNGVSIGYGLLVNGGATLNRHTYRVLSTIAATALTPSPTYAMRNSVTANFATPVDVTGALTNGASGSTFDIQGVIEATASGYITPQITFLGSAPTGATLPANATIRVFPVGSTGTNTVIGNWV